MKGTATTSQFPIKPEARSTQGLTKLSPKGSPPSDVKVKAVKK